MSECQVDGCWECPEHSGETTFVLASSKHAPEDSAATSITYEWLEQSYQAGCKDGKEPSYLMVSPQLYTNIKSKFQAQQTFYTYNTFLDLSGIKFHNATIVVNKALQGNEALIPVIGEWPVK